MADHPRAHLDDHFASPIRFSVLAALNDDIELDFASLGEAIDAGDSALSKAISHLSAAGYVKSRRTQFDGRPRTWIMATRAGRTAFSAHLAALRAIVEYGAGPRAAQPRSDANRSA